MNNVISTHLPTKTNGRRGIRGHPRCCFYRHVPCRQIELVRPNSGRAVETVDFSTGLMPTPTPLTDHHRYRRRKCIFHLVNRRKSGDLETLSRSDGEEDRVRGEIPCRARLVKLTRQIVKAFQLVKVRVAHRTYLHFTIILVYSRPRHCLPRPNGSLVSPLLERCRPPKREVFYILFTGQEPDTIRTVIFKPKWVLRVPEI